jgi:hypothetical protein
VYVTVNVRLRVTVDELDNFGRKMGRLNILELHRAWHRDCARLHRHGSVLGQR